VICLNVSFERVQGEERGNIKGKGGDAEKEKREGGENFSSRRELLGVKNILKGGNGRC